MRRLSLIPLLSLLLFFSCSKKELTQVSTPSSPHGVFIDVADIKNEKLVGFAKELNRQDSLKPIQDYFNKKYGTLLWNEALVQQKNRDIQAIIPSTKTSQTTEGFLVCNFINGKYSFELFNKGSALSNGYEEKPGKFNNYQVQAIFDYYNAKLYNITSRPLLTIFDIADTAQRRRLIRERGNTDVGGLYAKYPSQKVTPRLPVSPCMKQWKSGGTRIAILVTAMATRGMTTQNTSLS